jgi:capsular polysaccharide transport system permease protein
MMTRTRAAREPVVSQAPQAQLPAAASGTTITPLVIPGRERDFPAKSPSRLLSLRAVSFVVVVLLPVLAAAVYYLAIAGDQYVAEFRMSLRTVDAPRVEPILLLGGDTAHTSAATESQIVAQYIASRAIVDELDPRLDLRRMFSPPAADFWSRLWLPASIEQLVRFWRNQVDPFYDTTTGTIIVKVRAFSAADALTLAQAIVASSERLVNELSVRARRDAVGQAEGEVGAAETRLKAALSAIQDFRDKQGLIDPGKSVDATTTLATKLRDDLLKANAELATLKSYMHDDAPTVRVLKARIRSLETQQRALSHELTASRVPQSPVPAPALSQALGSYETLEAERKFAEAAYQHALEGLDKARDNANRQHIYIESFVPPSLPEMSLYPRRWRTLGTVALIAFAIWAIGSLAVQSIRDHL